MDPTIIANTPRYEVLAYDIRWDNDAPEWPQAGGSTLTNTLLDFRAYQPWDKLTDDQIQVIAKRLLQEQFGVAVDVVYTKVIFS